VSNQHDTQTIASQPSKFTWHIHKMILDGWEGDPLALSLKKVGICQLLDVKKTSLQNILFEPESRCPISMAPKPLLLNHPSSLGTSTK
jgi:hypothetical protein